MLEINSLLSIILARKLRRLKLLFCVIYENFVVVLKQK